MHLTAEESCLLMLAVCVLVMVMFMLDDLVKLRSAPNKPKLKAPQAKPTDPPNPQPQEG